MIMKIRKLLARQGTIEILLFLVKNKNPHYGAISKVIGSHQITTSRLKELVDEGFIQRNVMQDPRRTVQYSITKKGKELAEIALRILELEK